MTRRAADVLLRVAARRWPTDLRAGLHREWSAELHVLATRGRRAQMLRFAASLAASRPGSPLTDRSLMNRRIRRTAIALLLAPLACVGIFLVSAVIMNVVVGLLSRFSWSMALQVPLLTALTGTLAVVLAVFAARWARHTALTGPVRIALGVLIPIGTTAGLIEYGLNSDTGTSSRTAPGLLLWLTGLTLVLWGAVRLAGRGRVRAAWWLGILGAITVADLAVILTVINHIPAASPVPLVDGLPQNEFVDRISAPLWLFVSYTDWAFGLPRPTDSEIFLITDLVDLQPFLYLACTPYALTYAIRAAREQPTGLTSPEPTPTPSPSAA
ncbi:hypothetical protein DLE60_09755 [Micromonospora globispora]|uniref:Uncharacterized protein n=1 Tax=Micromonospora globispora TaxID=1450148 RepID=A0A317KD70_9ACTN|nr:hypothetical protein DLJ46_07775 [Micromonospora globispora]PWU60691.1 hypothetical protein DLE60_09755 [Micromonospora globispora]RQX00709.1 hypothetical protein DKL51_06440 [Micromonospora globispora]